MTRPAARWLVSLSVLTLMLAQGCRRSIAFNNLSDSDHAQVMDLLQTIYKSGLGDHIVAWYNADARGYYDFKAKKNIEFPAPISTLTAAVPEYLTATEPIEERLRTAASTTIVNGWKLSKFAVEVSPGGGGGTMEMSYDTVTIYPFEVEKH
jgi:hypothetical protein